MAEESAPHSEDRAESVAPPDGEKIAVPEANRASGAEHPRRLALLTDGTDERAPKDLLEHVAVARTLAGVIRDTENEEPLGIALYGAWGQGKSTIGRLLREELEKELSTGRIVFVKIDAWKYAYEDSRLPLRRHFLLQAYEDAGYERQARDLRQGFRSERTSQQPKSATSHRAKAIRNAIGRWLSSWTLTRAAVWGGVIVSYGVLVGFGSLRTPAHWILVVGFGSLLTLLVGFLPMFRDGLFVTTRQDPAWSIEVFDEHLAWLLAATKGSVDRFVFLIDDLDRCSEELIVQAIATLQAFFGRPRCAYIVAADEEQLKRAVRHSSQGPARPFIDNSPIPADETFLEKIFQVAAYVPRPSPVAIQRFARTVASETRLQALDDAERESILAYLVHLRVSSPRQARVVINDFLLTWAQAEEREAEPGAHLRRGELTDAKLLMAKLVVLRSHFPWFFGLLYESPGLLSIWQRSEVEGFVAEQGADVAIAAVRDAAGRAAREMNAYGTGAGARTSDATLAATSAELTDALQSYLSLTRKTLPRDATQMQEFIYLRSRQEFADLVGAGGQAYLDAIAAGDERALRAAYSRDPEQAAAAVRAAVALASEFNPVQQAAGRRALLELIGLMNVQQIREIGREATEVLYGDDSAIAEQLQEEDPTAHAKLVRWMPDGVLAEHSKRTPIDSFQQTRELALAVASRRPQVWEGIVRRGIAEQDASALIQGVRRIGPRLVRRLVAPTVAAARGSLETVTERFDNWAVTVTAREER